MGKLDGKVALVTGAGTGLGKAIAKRLAEQGATVALNGRREERLLVMTKACLPLLRESGNGKLISVTSGMVNYFMEGMGAYSATKAAAEALMKTVAVEEEPNGVQVTLFDPINVVSEGNPDGQYAAMDVAAAVAELAASPVLEKQGEIVKPRV